MSLATKSQGTPLCSETKSLVPKLLFIPGEKEHNLFNSFRNKSEKLATANSSLSIGDVTKYTN
jgi:hypothetical protein